MTRLLVLGSEGFIGSNAVAYFNAMGYEVTSADIVLKDAPGYLMINPEMPDFSRIFLNRPFDICINATGAANVQFSFTYPGIDFILNSVNVYSILDSILKYNSSCKFINLSSAAVYGNPTSLPINEKAEIRPLSPYGYHKWYSEEICRQFHVLHDLKTLSLRIFSAYGERLQKQLFWDLYKKINEAEDSVELFGTGAETRDFIYISDILFAIECVINKAVFDGSAINVASGTETTIEEAAHLFLKASGKQVKMTFRGQNKVGDPLNWRADINFLKSLGFKNRVSLDQGINKYCKWLREKN